MTDFVDTTKLYIREISKSVAKDMIIKNHYTHKWSLCRVAYGIFYKSDKYNNFFNTTDDVLIGCAIFGQPVGRSAAESITPLIKINQVLELTRLWVKDIPNDKNIESYSISQCIKQIKIQFPDIKCIISYADGEQSHKGTIYQACNFLYQGNSSVALMPNYSISLTKNPYNWMHSRTVSSKYGSHNVEHLKRTIGKTFYRKKESNKHRYILFISNKGENRKFIKSLKHPILPYPKNNKHIDEIQEFLVENNSDNSFF